MAATPDYSRLLTESQLHEFILRELGAPQVQVDLIQEDLDNAVDQSKRWFSSKKGFKKTVQMQLLSNVTEYELPADVDTVVELSFPARSTDFTALVDPLRLLDVSIPYNFFTSPASGGMFSSYAQAIQYLKTGRRIIGAEVEWSQLGKILSVFPIPKETSYMVVLYKANRFTIEQLNERDHDLVKRYALAHAKRKLGRVRSKYDVWPGAQGTVAVDGVRLLQEAQEEMVALDEEIAQSGYPMGFLIG